MHVLFYVTWYCSTRCLSRKLSSSTSASPEGENPIRMHEALTLRKEKRSRVEQSKAKTLTRQEKLD